MELAVIILNWNAAPDTIRCVREVSSWQHLRVTVWVVDNNSTDGSAETIARECPGVRLVRNSVNQGFAGGNNTGLERALAEGDAPLLLLNNDAFVGQKDVLQLLETLQSDAHIGFVGPLLFDAKDEARLLSAGGRNPVLHHHSHIYELPGNDPVRVVEYVPGTVIVGRAKAFRTVGLLDPAYFFTMEVADLCARARQQGFLSVIDARARATHALGRSANLRETLYPYYIIRNRFLFIRKFYPRSRFLLYAVWTFYSLALILKVGLAGKPEMSRAVRLGLWDGLRGRFGGQNERVLSVCSGQMGETMPSP